MSLPLSPQLKLMKLFTMDLKKCLSIYLNVPLDPQQLVNTLLHQAFITNGPTIVEPLESLQLNPQCFERGAIRLWTYNLHINDDTIPEKAKTFYMYTNFFLFVLQEHTLHRVNNDRVRLRQEQPSMESYVRRQAVI